MIIGAAQVSQRPPADDRLVDAPGPIELMTQAVRDAAADAGSAPRVIAEIDAIAVVGGLWRFRNPGALVATDLGLTDTHTMLTTFGGDLPIHLTHHLAERIRSGEFDLAVVAGGECTLTRRNLARRGEAPRRREETDVESAESFGPLLDMGDEVASARGGEHPRNTYAVLDSALRADRGESLDAARDRAASLWAGYAEVAAANPHATDRSAPGFDEIRTPSPSNRMVSWPYTKAMCANNTVDHAGAVLLCSEAKADELGIPREQRVYPHLCVTARDSTTLLTRQDLHVAPGLAAAAAAVLDAVGGAATIDHLDLYSCFPSMVTLTSQALGIDTNRPLTVTGGLAFAGAPLNFAAGEALIAMTARLRDDPGAIGLVQGNGGHATKHALGVYSTRPPDAPHHIDEIGPVGDRREAAEPERRGLAVLDGVTVEFDRSGPTRAVALVRFDDGARTWANSEESELMARFVEEEMVGRRVTVDAGSMALAQGV